jgi:YcxB-like protein
VPPIVLNIGYDRAAARVAAGAYWSYVLSPGHAIVAPTLWVASASLGIWLFYWGGRDTLGAVCVAASLAAPVGVELLTRKYAAQLQTRWPPQSTLTLTDRGIQVAAGGATSSVPWSDLTRVISRRRCLMLEFGRGRVLPLPRGVVSSEAMAVIAMHSARLGS